MYSLPRSTCSRACSAIWLELCEFSAFCLVALAISSIVEEVSSILAACCDAPSANVWLDWDTCPAAVVICPAPLVNSSMA